MATPKTLTTDECNKLLYELLENYPNTNYTGKGIRNHTIALLMLDAGLRVGEVVQLRISDLYFNSVPVTSIIIRQEIAKNKTERIIPVSHRLSNALKNHLASLRTPNIYANESYCFRSVNSGKPLTTRQVERIIRSAAEKSLGRPVHPHVLRHTFASNLMRVTDMRTVQELLGHKQLSSTQIYTHPNAEDKRKAIESIENVPPIGLTNPATNAPLPNIPNRPDTTGTDRDMG